MNEKELRSMYDRITVSDTDRIRIKNRVLNAESKAPRRVFRLVFATAVFMTVLLMIPDVRISAAEFLKSVTYRIFSGSASADLELKEQPVFTDNSRPALFNEIPEAEETFGIDLLDTSDETCLRTGLHLRYHPVIVYDRDQKDRVCGMSFQNYVYVTGDLEECRVQDSSSLSIEPDVLFRPGEKYNSPLGIQIRIITDIELAQQAGLPVDPEINADDPLGLAENESAVSYHIDSIDANALILSTNADESYGIGPAVWEGNGNPVLTHMTTAVFSWNGAEYTCFGDVSIETMQDFLETLHS